MFGFGGFFLFVFIFCCLFFVVVVFYLFGFVSFLRVLDLDEEMIVLNYMRRQCGFLAAFICYVTGSSYINGEERGNH